MTTPRPTPVPATTPVPTSAPTPFTRRDFLTGLTAAGAVWVAGAVACSSGDDPAVSATHLPSHAADSTGTWPPALRVLTPEQATELDAVTARIIPSDGTPGAREAGVVYFVDSGLATYAADQKPAFVDGLAMLSREVAKRHPGQARFSALTETQQDEILRGIESSEFFGNTRFATIAGMFTLPRYGGNHDYVGWKLVGQENVFDYKPPFGWYDRPENQRALLGRVL